jgi:hypothetical protein
MSVFEHSRWKIFNPAQHPYRHSLSEFLYVNPRMPGINSAEDALNYVISVLYPNYIGTYANPGALPVGADPNDYAIVTDDGDGNSAGYVWSVIDNAGQWIKRYDVDWSLESILAETVNRTQYMYAHKYGVTDLDQDGNALSGIRGGQTIYGGNLTNQHLTFNANSADGTGYVQTDNSFRPTQDGALDLGTSSLKWQDVYTGRVLAGTLTLASGSITDSSGAISFGDEDLATTGTFAAAQGTFSGSATVSTLSLAGAEITDSTGVISFGDEDLVTTGTWTMGGNTAIGDLILDDGSIVSNSGAIDFGANNLSTTGTFAAGAITGTSLNVDNLSLDGNTLSTTNADGNLSISPNGTGSVSITSALALTGNFSTTNGNITTTNGQVNAGNLRLNGNTLSTQDANGNLLLGPNGSGLVSVGGGLFPATDSALDLGKTGNVWNKLWIDGSIGGATEITLSDLLTLRSVTFRDAARTQAAQSGDSLFYNGTQWLASAPDTEVDHGSITGLGDDDHSQYALLAGRGGGQHLRGGVNSGSNLTLTSTAHATQGTIFLGSNTAPLLNASFSVTWSGRDFGGSSNYWRDMYMKGEFRGFRFENFTSATLPTASASAKGRTIFSTDDNKIYADNGTAFQVVSVSRFISDTSWDGSTTQKDVTVTGIADARNALWQLRDNSNSYEVMNVKISATSATNVRIDSSPALPAGSYRLIGLE